MKTNMLPRSTTGVLPSPSTLGLGVSSIGIILLVATSAVSGYHHGHPANSFSGSCPPWHREPFSCPASDSAGPKCDGFINEGKLMLLQVVFRNGDRAPIDPYPNDPWKHPWYWPMGYGQLTPVGRSRMVCLGQWVRATYHNFFCEPCYNFTLHGIRSSYTDRTRLSAELFMLGIYPPPGGATKYVIEKAPTNMYYIQTKPRAEDSVLRADVTCPAADEEEMRVRKNNPHFVKACHDYAEARDMLNANAGYGAMELTRLAGKVYDTLKIEQAHKMCLPEWTNQIYPSALCDLAGLDMFAQSMGMNMRRLRAGVLMTYLVSNMKNKINQPALITPDWTACARKFYVFSTHARVVANLLGAFGYKKTHVPSFGAIVMVELRYIDPVPPNTSPYFVKVIYKDGDWMETLQIPGCDCLCPLATFDKYLEDNGLEISPMGFRQECPGPVKDNRVVGDAAILRSSISVA